jgi:hypothetical protein
VDVLRLNDVTLTAVRRRPEGDAVEALMVMDYPFR